MEEARGKGVVSTFCILQCGGAGFFEAWVLPGSPLLLGLFPASQVPPLLSIRGSDRVPLIANPQCLTVP